MNRMFLLMICFLSFKPGFAMVAVSDDGTDYIAPNGMVFRHNSYCSCCFEQCMLVISGARVKKIHFPFLVGRQGFNKKTGELSFLGEQGQSFSIKPSSDSGQISISARVFGEDGIYEFTTQEWPNKEVIIGYLEGIPKELIRIESDSKTNNKQYFILPAQLYIHLGRINYPIYSKITDDGMILHATMSDSIAPLGLMVILNGQISIKESLLPIKINDVDGYRGTVVVCGQTENGKNQMLVIKNGEIQKIVNLEMEMIISVEVFGTEGRVKGFPKEFNFHFAEDGTYLGKK